MVKNSNGDDLMSTTAQISEKLADLVYTKKTPFTLEDIFFEIKNDYENKFELKRVLNSLKENGLLIQQGSTYSLKRFR